MQYVTIKSEVKNGEEYFAVSAIPLKNTNKSIVQKIPHPLGSDVLVYSTLEEAKDAVTRAGFSYILPSGEKGSKTTPQQKIVESGYNYERIILDAIKDKVNSTNSTVSASAILAISEFPNEEIFDILFEKLGEDNDLVRKNAISGICRYGNLLQDRVISSLKSSNWVERNSAISCIASMIDGSNVDIEKFIIPLTEVCSDSNTIVQSNALGVLASVYQSYKKIKKT